MTQPVQSAPPAKSRADAFEDAVSAQIAGDLARARQLWTELVAAQPDNAHALANFAALAYREGQIDEALALIDKAVTAAPLLPEIWRLKARWLDGQGRRRDAVQAWRRLLALAPSDGAALADLGASLRAAEQITLADKTLSLAFAHAENKAWILAQRADLQLIRGDFETAYTLLAQADALAADTARAAQARLLTAIADPQQTAAGIAALNRKAAAAFDAVPSIAPAVTEDDAERPLTLGMVSHDFRLHSVARFVLPVLEGLRRLRDGGEATGIGRVLLYKADTRSDRMTEALLKAADGLRSIHALDDDAAAAAVRADGVDILFDLSGWTFGNRLGLFARRPAPVQASWIGYPASTGLTAIDVRLTDGICDPAGIETVTGERLARLPAPFLCFAPTPDAPAVTPPPALAPPALKPADNSVTFGSFGSLHKWSDPTIALWADVLRAVPGSRLLLKGFGLLDDQVKAYQRARFAAAGVDGARLAFLEFEASEHDHLGAYAQVDIALDSTPYAGTTTTCEALWQGVPVVTLEGRTHAGRVGASLLHSVGLPELVAADGAAFVSTAAALAGDLDHLSALRAGLRARLAASPLLDSAGMARRLSMLCRGLWRDRCAGRVPGGGR